AILSEYIEIRRLSDEQRVRVFRPLELLSGRYKDFIIDELDIYKLNPSELHEVALQLIRQSDEDLIAKHRARFAGIDFDRLVNVLLDWNKGDFVQPNIEQFEGLRGPTLKRLIDRPKRSLEIAEYLKAHNLSESRFDLWGDIRTTIN